MLTPNTTLQHGRYRIISRIAQGGMGAVYEAYDNNLSNRVALKEALISGDASLRRAFEREAQRLDRLRHAALPNVKDHFIEGNGQYLVMEYIDGQDLGQMLKQRGQPFPVADVLAWADTLLDALTYLHNRNPPLIHRDIKPANLKLTPDEQIILLDFGLARGGLTRRTQTGHGVYGYTPGYAPPEQIEDQPTDARSDLYGLAATLYALLTAQAPDDPFSRQRYIDRGYPDPLQPANELNPQVPPYVAQALQQSMALDPNQRPNSAAQMRALLNKPFNEPTVAPIGQPQGIAPTRPVQTTLLGVMMAAVLLIGIAVGIYLVGNGGNDEPVIVVVTETPAPTEPIEVEPTATQPPPPTETATLAPTATQPPPPTETATLAPTATQPLPTATPPPPTATPTLGIGATAIAQKDGMVQLYVPEGDFEMGSGDDDPDANDDEKPRHTVYLNAFWIDQTEVTNVRFANFVAETGHQTDAEKEGSGWVWDGSNWNQVNGADWQHPQGPESDLDGLSSHPVIQVSWNDANAYCEWADRRLPTEAEWEKAAGGTDERKYPWGNDAPTGELVNFCDQSCTFDHKDSSENDGYERTSPVGNYPAGASPYGVLDMAGNVSEWVSDTYDSNYYASSPRENPTGPFDFGNKVVHSGSWNNAVPDIRVRKRGGGDNNRANNRGENHGFRCARSP